MRSPCEHVMDALNRRAKPARAYTTYMTVMRRLNDKGILDRKRSGNQGRLRRPADARGVPRATGRRRSATAGRRVRRPRSGSLRPQPLGLDPARREALQRLADGDQELDHC